MRKCRIDRTISGYSLSLSPDPVEAEGTACGTYINRSGIENQIPLGHGLVALSADSERAIEVSAHFRHVIRNEWVGDIQGEMHELDITADMVGLAHLV